MSKGRKAKDLTGQKFGRLTVISKGEKPSHVKSKATYWICQCECGNVKTIIGTTLRNGATTSCGCYRNENTKKIQNRDLTGQKFGRLLVMSIDEKESSVKRKTGDRITTRKYYKCQCDCGKIVSILGNSLTTGKTMSCGCYKKDEMTGNHSRFWKGGITSISMYLRMMNSEWNEKCKKQANYKCQLTGRTRDLRTHHLYALSNIILDAHNIYNIQIKEQVKDYTDEEIRLLEKYVGEWHKDNSNGVVLCEQAHKLFHKLYGKGNNTPEQYIEFKERYLAGEFKEILK